MKKRIISVLTITTMVISLLSGCAKTANSDAVEVFANVNESTETMTETEPTETTEATETAETETEPTEETTETETTVEEETAEETTQEETPAFTYEDMSAVMYATQSVNVRSLPDVIGERLGALALNQEVAITGKCVETGWYRINYNNSTGYVSNKYLSDSKIEVKVEQPVVSNNTTSNTTPNTDGAQSSNTNTSAENPYPLYEVIDNGGTDVYFYWLYDGTPMKSSEYWECFDACIEILKTRVNGDTEEAGFEWTKYYVDGLRVTKATPKWYIH